MTAFVPMSPGRAHVELTPAGGPTPQSGGVAGAEAHGPIPADAKFAARRGHGLIRDLPAIPGLTLSRALIYLPGRDQIFQRLLLRFAEQYDHGFPALATALANQRWAQACALLHSLRGACGAIGATELLAQAGALEQTLGGLVDDPALAERSPAPTAFMPRAGDATPDDALLQASALQPSLAALVRAIQDGVAIAQQP